MKCLQTVYRDENAFRKTVSEWKEQSGSRPVLLHVFTDGAAEEDIRKAEAIIAEIMPDAP